MSAVWYRARAELRSRLPAVIALAVIVGVIGGVVIAAAAGARRTQTAYPRLLEASNALDVVTSITARDPAVGRRLQQEIQQLPQVEAYSRVELATGVIQVQGRAKPGQVFPIVSPDGRFGTTINRFKILEGRTVNPRATDEIVPSFAVADDLGLRVGQTVRLVYGGLFINGPAASPRPDPVALHVVGIGAAPGMFQPLAGGYLPGVLVSRGFYRIHHDFIQRDDWTEAIVLRRGFADLHPYLLAVKQIRDHAPPRSHIDFGFNQFQQTAGVQQATHTQAISFWVLAALVAVAGIAIFGQALARQTFLESVEYPTLRSLGVSPSQLFALGMIRAVFTGLVGAGIAVVVAFALSPLTPTGVARIAEPNPGFAFDGMAIGIGAAGIVVSVIAFGAIPAWRAAVVAGTASGAAELPGSQRPSAIAALIGRAWRSPSSTAGVRMALEPGRGRTAVPVRTTMFGAAISLFALAAALSFGASLDRLVSTPGLSGWNWNTMLFCCAGHGGRQEALGKRLVATLDRDPRVEGYAVGIIDSVGVGKIKGVTGLGMETRKGSVTPSLVDGRLPEGPDEILLGTATMQKAGVGIGDTVPVSGKAGTLQMTVVGRVAMPPLFFSFTGPGQGAAVSLTAFERLEGGHRPPDVGGFFIRVTPGTNLQDFNAGLKQKVGGIFIVPQPESGQLSNLRGITDVPLVLAGIVALMAAATLAHTLVTSIRRRRLDFAIMKTLGFVRGQVSAAVAWQASTLAAVAVLVGLPLGIISGRWGWNLLADRLGVVPDAVVPILAILIAVPVTIVVANLIAVLPGRIAARLKAAPVLRSE